MAWLSRRRVKRARRRLGVHCLRSFGPHVFRWLARSWRTELIGEDHLEHLPRGAGYILCIWHGRMIMGVEHFRQYGLHVLVSPSEDGDVSESLLEAFHYRVIRGSTSRGGARALREMRGVLASGGKIVITPDGPRGPRHSMNEGVAWLVRATGFPAFPLGMTCDRAWHVRSWDAFTVPKPRARVAFVLGEPIRLERDAGPLELAQATETLRERLLALERRGFEHLDREPDW